MRVKRAFFFPQTYPPAPLSLVRPFLSRGVLLRVPDQGEGGDAHVLPSPWSVPPPLSGLAKNRL